MLSGCEKRCIGPTLPGTTEQCGTGQETLGVFPPIGVELSGEFIFLEILLTIKPCFLCELRVSSERSERAVRVVLILEFRKLEFEICVYMYLSTILPWTSPDDICWTFLAASISICAIAWSACIWFFMRAIPTCSLCNCSLSVNIVDILLIFMTLYIIGKTETF